MWLKLAVLLLFLLCFDFMFVNCLDPKDKGVCVDKKSVQKSRTKYYTAQINKKCGKRKCVVKKSKKEMYTAINENIICCKGWEYLSNEDKCVPYCSLGCRGRCTAPDVCVLCDPPGYFDDNNTCITPVCEQPCINSQCRQNNTCECLPDYVTFNSTYCRQACADGYIYSPENDTCDPQCDSCVNGECTAPNNCSCYEGYIMKDKVCTPSCVNCDHGRCVSPNTCICDEGYLQENGSCVPQCKSCVDGTCVAPNQCECREGFTKREGVCQPHCSETCINGVCSAPDICTCNEGFVRSESRYWVCYKPCSRCVGCTPQGVCVPDKECDSIDENHGKKTVLTCCSRWQPSDDGCKAICRLGCDGGTCIAPDVCHCPAPLVLYTNQTSESCVPPHCDSGCPNGVCTANNNCTCNHGYAKVLESCEPICKNCTNGVCSAPDVCLCNPGYEINEDVCVPKCGEVCVNATCTAPDFCSCNKGYEATDNPWECRAYCYDCKHGVCVAPDNCRCDAGFVRENNTCISVRPVECASCGGACSESPCWCPDGRPCYHVPVVNEMTNPPRNLATLTWVFAATAAALLVAAAAVVAVTWRRRVRSGDKGTADKEEHMYGSVAYTVANTLTMESAPSRPPSSPADLAATATGAGAPMLQLHLDDVE